MVVCYHIYNFNNGGDIMQNVLDLLQEAVERYPQKAAIVDRDRIVTFAELDLQARKIGAAIRKHDLVNAPVGVIASRDADTLIFFFGVLFSGNFYVPVDPGMPAEKKRLVFADAGFHVVVGKRENQSLLDPLSFEGTYLTAEDVSDEVADIPAVGGNDPAYMVYTSGSTGVPKGVLKSHKALLSFVQAYAKTFNFTEDEIIGNQTPFYFDASAKDIYMMLQLGCTLDILPSSLFTLPPELIDYLNTHRVSFISWVPTALSLVSQLNPFSYIKPTTLKKVFFVGEVMPMKHLNKWRQALPDIQYVNLYGQSELAGICCYYEVTGTFLDTDTLPMGKPLCNCDMYLLNGDQIITAPGQIGELYICSDAIALEYFHDPEKTKTCFTHRDFGNGLVRCFKTGDLAQYDEHGNLVFASRTDLQIKHMGHRIELGEIETIAGALEQIHRCCCVYDSDKRKIILFCQLAQGVQMSSIDIKRALKDKLSDYMLPGKVTVMDQLPLNANGKIDRQKLKTMI